MCFWSSRVGVGLGSPVIVAMLCALLQRFVPICVGTSKALKTQCKKFNVTATAEFGSMECCPEMERVVSGWRSFSWSLGLGFRAVLPRKMP